jgi:hypothetical protein
MMSVHDYGDAMLIFEVRGLPTKSGASQMDRYKGADVGNVIECEGGYLTISGRLTAAYDKSGKEIRRFDGTPLVFPPHMENFFSAVRSRKREDQRGELNEGHVSSSLCHLSNASYRLGQKSDPGTIRDMVKADANSMDTFERLAAHLAANEIDLSIDKAILGAPLQVDPQTQKVTNNNGATALFRQEYRAPFVVPESI